MKAYEYFNKGQEVYVLTNEGLRKGNYVGKLSETTSRISGMERPDCEIFTTKEAARKYLLTGERDNLPVVRELESSYNVGDHFFYFAEGRIQEGIVKSVHLRLGEWEYHTNRGGIAFYLDRSSQYYFKTREEAVENYLSK